MKPEENLMLPEARSLRRDSDYIRRKPLTVLTHLKDMILTYCKGGNAK